ncbi:MAG: sigma-70 family RNA polymerase sigma factor [Pseudomonadota bacterium]
MFSRQELNQLYRYSFTLIGNENDAYDLLHTCVEKYLNSQRTNIENPISYMKTIIRNQYIDIRRKESKFKEEQYEETVLYLDMDIESLDMTLDNKIQISEIWQLLTSTEREIMYLWAVEGYTTSELSKYLKISRGTLLSKIHRLRKRILDSLNIENKECV